MNGTMGAMVAVGLAVVGLAVVAVLVSKNANTSGVIQTAGLGFSSVIGTAISPVVGGSTGATGLPG